MIDVSLVIPVFNEEKTLIELKDKIIEVFNRENFNGEIIFINDGSSDSSSEILFDLKNKNDEVKYIDFRFNKGKAAALQSGFNIAKGEVVITMDADLQDDPNEIPNLIDKINEGWDVVSGWKKNRKDPISKRWPSKLFNFTTSFFSGIKIHDFNCGLKAYRNEVVRSIKVYGELHRYIPVLASMEGFKTTELIVKHHPREHGVSKYGFGRLFKGFFDLITVLFLARFTVRPMHFFGMVGLLSFSAGFVVEIWMLVLKFVFNESFGTHIAMLILGVLLLLLGVQLVSIGLIGEMLVYQSKKR
ncbi:MAG: glycosyltransferase family 2 protein, partial [Candidatus Marinimicrobia bacterium]|nr:glycosyltransferase family 2 protein [Candidatus Neomarinimicrobiota bacterium]